MVTLRLSVFILTVFWNMDGVVQYKIAHMFAPCPSNDLTWTTSASTAKGLWRTAKGL